MAKNKHNIDVGSTIERSDERIKVTQEVFTPMELVESMVNDIDIEILQDPKSTFIDNSAGCGNFLICLLYTSPSPRDATLSRMPSSA